MAKLHMPVEEAAQILNKYIQDINVSKLFGPTYKDFLICFLGFHYGGWQCLAAIIAVYVVVMIYEHFVVAARMFKEEDDGKEARAKMTATEREETSDEFMSNMADNADLSYSPKNA